MLTSDAMAKRVNPKPVAPVTANGVEYSADGDGRNQYVSATDISTAKELWRMGFGIMPEAGKLHYSNVFSQTANTVSKLQEHPKM